VVAHTCTQCGAIQWWKDGTPANIRKQADVSCLFLDLLFAQIQLKREEDASFSFCFD
jgi:hypothetical protein